MATLEDITTGLELPDPDSCTYSVAELAREHLVTYVLETKKGCVFLRRMPVRMRSVINQALAHLYPSRQKLIAELDALLPFVKDVPPEALEKDKADRVIEIGYELAVTDMTPLAVVVEPRLGSMEDWDCLYGSLDEDDRQNLMRAVMEMARERPPSEIDPGAEYIAERFGMRLVRDDMLPVETVSQRAYWMDRIRQENERIEKMRKS